MPLRVDLAVFSDSLKVLAKARWIGIIELSKGIKRPTDMASIVATQFGTIEIPSTRSSF